MGTFQRKQGALATLFHEAIATIAADMNKRLAVLQADSDLSGDFSAGAGGGRGAVVGAPWRGPEAALVAVLAELDAEQTG